MSDNKNRAANVVDMTIEESINARVNHFLGEGYTELAKRGVDGYMNSNEKAVVIAVSEVLGKAFERIIELERKIEQLEPPEGL